MGFSKLGQLLTLSYNPRLVRLQLSYSSLCSTCILFSSFLCENSLRLLCNQQPTYLSSPSLSFQATQKKKPKHPLRQPSPCNQPTTPRKTCSPSQLKTIPSLNNNPKNIFSLPHQPACPPRKPPKIFLCNPKNIPLSPRKLALPENQPPPLYL